MQPPSKPEIYRKPLHPFLKLAIVLLVCLNIFWAVIHQAQVWTVHSMLLQDKWKDGYKQGYEDGLKVFAEKQKEKQP